MSRRRLLGIVGLAIALVLLATGCIGGKNGEEAPPTKQPKLQAPPGGGADAPPASPNQLPPEFVKCMAEQGFDVRSSADIHSAPPQVLQACFGALHQAGG